MKRKMFKPYTITNVEKYHREQRNLRYLEALKYLDTLVYEDIDNNNERHMAGPLSGLWPGLRCKIVDALTD